MKKNHWLYSQTYFSDHLLNNNFNYVTLILISLHSAFHIKKNLYIVTTCLIWPYFNVPLEGHTRQVWLYTQLTNFYKNE